MNFGKLLIGIPLKLVPQTADRSFFEFYRFDRPLEWNANMGRVPPQDILMPARRVSALFGVVCCALVFVIGHCGR
jgi:hypothetical protein